jgi:hypothetical protein
MNYELPADAYRRQSVACGRGEEKQLNYELYTL